MTPDEIMSGMRKKNQALSMKNDELIELAEKKAQAERDYNIAIAKQVLELKQDGQSVTLIPTLAKGDSIVAELKYKADVADAVYGACREKIKDLRTAVDTYRTLLSWLKAELESR